MVVCTQRKCPSQSPPPRRARLTEKGLLQLLFDVRLLRDVLAGGRPAPAPGAPAPAAPAAQQQPGGSFARCGLRCRRRFRSAVSADVMRAGVEGRVSVVD